jgi:Ca2+-binding RTX toxin-like protein
MPQIRIEWVPVQTFKLGILGFDHLQLVFQPDEGETAGAQDQWYVMEGVRDDASAGPLLGIEGADGRTTLAAANVAAREDLIAKIGTPDYRGSRSLPYGGDEFRTWETMASYARDIEDQDYPYIPLGLPGSPTPTVNSSSAVASLIHYSGLDPSRSMPFGLHLSPGTATLLGTSGDDVMRMEHGFNTLLGGRGRDEFFGGSQAQQIEKFYGGAGDDLIHWSSGFNIIHGGQPQLDYAEDGTDVVDYSGAGRVAITYNPRWIAHKVPQYVAETRYGYDHLYSIERIQWNQATDEIVPGNGVRVVEDDAVLQPGGMEGERPAGPAHRSGRLVHDGDEAGFVRATSDYELLEGEKNVELAGTAVQARGNGENNRIVGNDADNVLRGMAGDDTLYGGAGDDVLIGGSGSDGYIYLPGDGHDVMADSAAPGETDELVLAGGIVPAEVALLRPQDAPRDLVFSFPDGGSITIRDFFASPSSGIERVIFDRAPAWDRADLDRFAADAPHCGESTSGEATHACPPPLWDEHHADVGFAVPHFDPHLADTGLPDGDGQSHLPLPLESFLALDGAHPF